MFYVRGWHGDRQDGRNGSNFWDRGVVSWKRSGSVEIDGVGKGSDGKYAKLEERFSWTNCKSGEKIVQIVDTLSHEFEHQNITDSIICIKIIDDLWQIWAELGWSFN